MQKKISIITVCFNAANELEKTLKSVQNQSFTNFELIIVDGGSRDHTKEIAKKFKDIISSFISEPDKGIYDAMNKGVNLSTGEYIVFMNGGDSFHDHLVLDKILPHLAGFDFVYGDQFVIYESGFKRYHKGNSNINEIWKGMPTSHQSFFSKRELLQSMPFNLDIITADFQFTYNSFLKGATFRYVPITISDIEAGGVSDTNRVKVIKEKLKIINQNNFNLKYNFYHVIILIISKIMEISLNKLPKSIKNKLIKMKYFKFNQI